MRFLIGFLLALWLPHSSAWADERILKFTSDAQVNVDASVDVTETIDIIAEGAQIKRGILRDFPTIYEDRNGLRVVVGFDVTSVKRNGQDENYALESISNGKRIRIGSADAFLEHGLHIYEIKYSTTRQLGFFEDYDELYWNATGNGWTFPIDNATAIVRLPPGASIVQHQAYTGHQGESGRDFTVISGSGNEYRAVSTRGFVPGEGLTVAVAWQKGIVAAPTAAEKNLWFLRDNAGVIGLLATLLGVAFYYFYAWNKVGRDPPEGTIVPLFSPPAALGPAAARFVWKQEFDDKAFAAALVGLAVKGHLKISDDGDEFSITRQNSTGSSLTRSENGLFAAIPSGTTTLRNANHAAISRMQDALDARLTKEYEDSAFVRNIGWFWAGALLSIGGLLLSALLLPLEEGLAGLFAAGWSGIWWGVILTVAWSSLSGFMGSRGFLRKIGSVMSLLFLIPFVIAGVAVPGVLLFGGGITAGVAMLLAAAVGLGVMNLVFHKLLRAPTISGRKLLDQVEGFRMYMKTAEEERLKILNPPEKTPELFEKYLPYALALDCENEWNAKFAAVLAAAAAAGATAPAWYSGDNWNSGDMGGFTDSLGSSLASSAASASVAPGSSSGSGGGGSSGGGGGGGGGSGW